MASILKIIADPRRGDIEITMYGQTLRQQRRTRLSDPYQGKDQYIP
jgi:hypothetical protein